MVGPHYAASKAGLAGLAHAYAALLAREGITANVIAPALIDTEMVRNNPKARPDLIPLGRFGTPRGGGRGRRVGRGQRIHHRADDQRERRVVYVVVNAGWNPPEGRVGSGQILGNCQGSRRSRSSQVFAWSSPTNRQDCGSQRRVRWFQ